MVSHVTIDELEEYLCGRIAQDRIAAVEEHLLICPGCRVACTRAEADWLAIRQAAVELRRDAREPVRRWRGFRMPVPVFGGIAAVALGVFVLTNIEPAPRGVSEVSLVATRAVAENAVAKSGTALRLHLDTATLDAQGPFKVDLVDLRGRNLWSGDVSPRSGEATVSIGKALKKGRYWVRLNSPAGEPLREFQLDVR